MSFRQRMGVIVGDQNNVARYLTEKVGHTALIAWSLWSLSHWSPVHCGIIAMLAYLIIGKVIWWTNYRDSVVVSDLIFDLVVGSFVPIIALGQSIWTVVGLTCWIVYLLIGSNNQWGRPS